MIELIYRENYETVGIAGRTVAEARALYKEAFGIPDKAVASLNGNKVKANAETETTLCDDDSLVFSVPRKSRVPYLVGALVLALAITGGTFAYGFTFSSVTLGASTTDENFAEVTANTSIMPNWTALGMEIHQTGAGTLFDIDTAASGYTGDFVATVSLTNVNKLAHVYKVFSLSIEVRDSLDNIVDINYDGNADSNDFTILSLDNGYVDLAITQAAADTYTVKIKSGYYLCNVYGSSWGAGDGAPELFCELLQK